MCLRWVDENLVDHKDVLGLYNVGTIEAESLIKAITDVACKAGTVQLISNVKSACVCIHTHTTRALLESLHACVYTAN